MLTSYDKYPLATGHFLFVMPSTGVATGFAPLIAPRITQPICLDTSSAFNISSTLPRTTRSRWFLIRSSSIVTTLPKGLGVVSIMAAPFLLSWLPLATSSSARFGAASPTQLCETFRTSSKKHGLKETEASITNKLKRATFPATFFLAVLAALELDGVALEEI